MPARRGARTRLVTLTSDIGWAYAAQMKAVLLRTVEPGRVVDLTHDLPAHSIREAAFVARAMCAPFPSGTVHVVVVDPGVGGKRAPIVLECADASVLVGPDNGVLTPLAQALGGAKAYRVDPASLDAPARVGTTFDGRDLFAPAAAALAAGTRPADLGPPHRPTELTLPPPRKLRRGAKGEVLHVDRFGNLITNVPTGWVPTSSGRVRVRVGRGSASRLPWVRSYEALGAGNLGLLGSSFGTVEIAIAEGRAEARLRARTGTTLELGWIAPRKG